MDDGKKECRKEIKYEGWRIGPVLRNLRQQRKMTIEEVSEATGLSVSTVKQVERGGRKLSLNSLYRYMQVFECDANTILDIEAKTVNGISVDLELAAFPKEWRGYFSRVFLAMLNQEEMLALRRKK